MNGNRIIVHTLITSDGKYLVTKRSENETTYLEYWNIPGGLVDLDELKDEKTSPFLIDLFNNDL